MTSFFFIHMHWNNRGDEAANRAMIEQIRKVYPDCKIDVQLLSQKRIGVETLKEQGINLVSGYFPRRRDMIELIIAYITKGKIVWSKPAKEFMKALTNADMVIHCPGGPSIGDIYIKAEKQYIRRLLLVKRMKKPYFFYAPSAGPFHNKIRNIYRKYIYNNAMGITFREDISGNYFHKLLPNKPYCVTLDSAFQNEINKEPNKKILQKYTCLSDFLRRYENVIGLTITDLQWNPLYKENIALKNKIDEVFDSFIAFLLENNYAVIFIPQLFGEQNDYDYMSKFLREGTFVLDDKFDCNFQQYIISKLQAVVGMRYHSNIFSCKMGIPFVSVSYEQKMKGFMKKTNLENYCIDINQLTEKELKDKFNLLIRNYDSYKAYLSELNLELKKESQETTNYLFQVMKNMQ